MTPQTILKSTFTEWAEQHVAPADKVEYTALYYTPPHYTTLHPVYVFEA